jgi:hypothetical protein
LEAPFNSGRALSDLVVIDKETLTPADFQKLADVFSEVEWLANITNPKTRRFYKKRRSGVSSR